MYSLRVLLVGFLLAFVIAACNGVPVDIETPEEVIDEGQFVLEGADEDLVEDESTTTEQHHDDDSDFQMLGGVGVDAMSNGAVENDDGETAAPPDSSVSKGLQSEGQTSYDDNRNNGNSANGVSVFPYTSSDKLIQIQWPKINDVIMAPIDAPTDVITMGNRRVIGRMIYSKAPEELVLFNGRSCTRRTYVQGTGQSQELDRRTCRELLKEMNLLLDEADELAENLETAGGQTAQNIANSFGQSLPYGSGNSWALGANNQLGSGIPFGNNGFNGGIHSSPFGTNPYGINSPSLGANSSPLIPNTFSYTANTYPNNPSSYGNTSPHSNTYPFGTYNTPIGNINRPVLAASNTSPLGNSNNPALGNYNTSPLGSPNSSILSSFNTVPFSGTNTPLNTNTNTATGNGTPSTPTATPGATNPGFPNSSNSARRRRRPTGTQTTNDIDNLINWLQ